MLELSLWLDRQDQKVKRVRKVALQARFDGELVFDLLVILAFACRLVMANCSRVLGSSDFDGRCLEPSETACSAIAEPGVKFNDTACNDPCELYDLGRSLYQVWAVLIALMTIRIIFGYLSFMNTFQPLGVLIITISSMMQDIILFLQLFVVVNLAFMVSGSAIQIAGLFDADCEFATCNGETTDPFAAEGEFWSPLWLTFGFFEPSAYTWVSGPVAYVYLFISCIVMVNLLVAMFAATFQRIGNDSEVEYVFIECQREHRRLHPPSSPHISHCLHCLHLPHHQQPPPHSALPPMPPPPRPSTPLLTLLKGCLSTATWFGACRPSSTCRSFSTISFTASTSDGEGPGVRGRAFRKAPWPQWRGGLLPEALLEALLKALFHF